MWTRASAAMTKNFISAEAKQIKGCKQAIVRLLEKGQLNSLCTKIKKTNMGHLELFFSVKMHKDGVPFRAIVSERATRQANKPSFWRNSKLSLVQCNDPYRIQTLEQLIGYLQEHGSGVVSGLSVNIPDMYYSIPYKGLFLILRVVMEGQGTTTIQNAAEITVDTFLELLSVYLAVTVVTHEGQHFVQKKRRVCLGSLLIFTICSL